MRIKSVIKNPSTKYGRNDLAFYSIKKRDRKNRLKRSDVLQTYSLGFMQLGISSTIFGICLFDKYCYTNIFRFEIL